MSRRELRATIEALYSSLYRFPLRNRVSRDFHPLRNVTSTTPRLHLTHHLFKYYYPFGVRVNWKFCNQIFEIFRFLPFYTIDNDESRAILIKRKKEFSCWNLKFDELKEIK